MPRMKLAVTAENINDSLRAASGHCMIASAIKRKVPAARWVLVDLQTIRWTDRRVGLRFIYMTPRPAQQALLDFDRGIPVKPFQFTLPPPEIRPVSKHKPRPKATASPNTKIYKKAKLSPERFT